MSTPMFETPKHHPIEVNARGQGPAEPEETVAIVCWCGDRTCTEFFKVIQDQRDDLTALHLLTDRQAELLTGVADAIHGKQEGTMWSHHDLPELVTALVESERSLKEQGWAQPRPVMCYDPDCMDDTPHRRHR